MNRPRAIALGLTIATAGYAIARHLRLSMGQQHPGGVVMGSAGLYDWASRTLLGSFYRGVANNVSAALPEGGRILEVGCGPGHLALEVANRALDVTGVDLDSAMIDRARINSRRRIAERNPSPLFEVGDVASLPYDRDSFDLVVSTLSLHHWADPDAALVEIARVLKPDGRALIWDFGAGGHALHGEMPDPGSHFHDSPLQLVSTEPWTWPLGFSPTQRMELRHRPQPAQL